MLATPQPPPHIHTHMRSDSVSFDPELGRLQTQEETMFQSESKRPENANVPIQTIGHEFPLLSLFVLFRSSVD